MSKTSQYWFPAKRYGWGWGPPTAWQGWAVLAVWIVVLLCAGFALLPGRPMAFQLSAVGMVLVLLLICYAKGEPPSWRWGGRK
jgi:hypothetical protein